MPITFPSGGANTVWRDRLVEGNPLSDKWRVRKSDVRGLLSKYESILKFSFGLATDEMEVLPDFNNRYSSARVYRWDSTTLNPPPVGAESASGTAIYLPRNSSSGTWIAAFAGGVSFSQPHFFIRVASGEVWGEWESILTSLRDYSIRGITTFNNTTRFDTENAFSQIQVLRTGSTANFGIRFVTTGGSVYMGIAQSQILSVGSGLNQADPAQRTFWVDNTTKDVFANSNTAAGSATILMTRGKGDARYQLNSSSARYKEKIRPSSLRSRPLEAKSWVYGNQLPEDDPRHGRPGLGFIAEDLAEIDDRLVTYNENQEVEGVNLLALSAYIYAFFDNRIHALEARLNEVASRVSL